MMKVHFTLSFFEYSEHRERISRPERFKTLDHAMRDLLLHYGAEDFKPLFPGTFTFTYSDMDCDLEDILNRWIEWLNTVPGIQYFIAPLMHTSEDESKPLSFHGGLFQFRHIYLKSDNANVELEERVDGGAFEDYPDFELVEKVEDKFAYLLQHRTNNLQFLTCNGGFYNFFRILPNWHSTVLTEAEIAELKKLVFEKRTSENNPEKGFSEL